MNIEKYNKYISSNITKVNYDTWKIGQGRRFPRNKTTKNLRSTINNLPKSLQLKNHYIHVQDPPFLRYVRIRDFKESWCSTRCTWCTQRLYYKNIQEATFFKTKRGEQRFNMKAKVDASTEHLFEKDMSPSGALLILIHASLRRTIRVVIVPIADGHAAGGRETQFHYEGELSAWGEEKENRN